MSDALFQAMPSREASIWRHAMRVAQRAMAVIRSLPFASRAGSFDREYERAWAMAVLRRTAPSPMRTAPTGFDDTSWAADEFARRMTSRIEVERAETQRIVKLITHTVQCSWCLAEGLPGVMHAGNPSLAPSHGICLRHQHALLEHAGLGDSSTDGSEDAE